VVPKNKVLAKKVKRDWLSQAVDLYRKYRQTYAAWMARLILALIAGPMHPIAGHIALIGVADLVMIVWEMLWLAKYFCTGREYGGTDRDRGAKQGMRDKVLLHIALQSLYLSALYCCQIDLTWDAQNGWMRSVRWVDMHMDLGLFETSGWLLYKSVAWRLVRGETLNTKTLNP
jgi:hypothetical protein